MTTEQDKDPAAGAEGEGAPAESSAEADAAAFEAAAEELGGGFSELEFGAVDTTGFDTGGFDTIGFDGGFDEEEEQDLDKTPAHGVPLNSFNFDSDPSKTPPQGTRLPEQSAASQLAAVMAEFGINVPEKEPDFGALQDGLIGLDLGSSDAVVACFNEDGKAVIVPNSMNQRTTPARLLRDPDDPEDWLIGVEARQLLPSQPEHDYGELKSLFLMEGWSTEIDGRTYSAVDLMGVFCSELIKDAEDHLDFKPTHVSLSAPVWFKPPQREALKAAVETAGYEVVGVTDELLAACVPYSLRLPDLQPRKAVVVDVGHKGSAIAFIECAGGDMTILCQAGLPDLGATNWDDLLIAESVRKFKQHHGFDPREDPSCMTDLNLRVEEAKKSLSLRKHYIMPIQANGKTLKVRFNRESFERASRRLLKRLSIFLSKVREKGELAEWSEFDALVVTGGGARMPMVKKAIEDTVGRQAEPFNAEESVAIGALYWGVSARHKANKAAEEARKS